MSHRCLSIHTASIILLNLIFLLFSLPASGQNTSSYSELITNKDEESEEQEINVWFLPSVKANSPWNSPFGTESNLPWLEDSVIARRGTELNIGWTRLGARISWMSLEPVEGDSIDWGKLDKFEKELRTLKSAEITPVVIIGDSPYWATVEPTSCAAIRTDKFPAFERFMRKLVERYKAPEFDLHNWELGNEPDVDPSILIKIDNAFGC